MQLQLKYSQHAHLQMHAAFVPGTQAAEWFAQMDAWQTDLQTLSCYLLPHSLANNQAAGLFIIFNGAVPPTGLIKYPYSKIGGKLFIPVDAALEPVVTADELTKLLLWEVQVFHPYIGMVGFDAGDKLSLANLILLPQPQLQLWNFAHPGLNSPAGLQMIGLEPLKAEADVVEDLNDNVGSMPLSQIMNLKGDSESSSSEILKKTGNAFAMAGLFFLLTLSFIGKMIFTIFSLIAPKSQPVRGRQKGLLQELEEWINKKMGDLQKQRDSELNRLMGLFDKDPDEALKYAIPLGSPYLNRGTAPQSGKLGKRSTDFNLGALGGGGRVDSWDVGNYQYALRKKYEQAANTAVAAGNFKRAAYIYAHLLSNFYSAANVLQQGKFYREAAALYKEHFKNNKLAAECLERGGLLSEAIPLYIEMDNPEKVGDLYTQLGRPDKALPYYHTTVDRLKTSKDYKQAAKITLEKLHKKDDALNVLLDGWKDTYNPEACLHAYFDLAHDEEQNTLPYEVRRIYADHVPRSKKTTFLNILADTAQKYKNKELEAVTLNIAYEVVSIQVSQGEMSGLKLMNKFVHGDRMLMADANRFINTKRELPPINDKATYLHLRNDTKCIDLVTYHDQLLAIGEKDGDLYLMRANWQGKADYEYLFKLQPIPQRVWIVADAGLSDVVMIVGDKVPVHIDKELGEYTDFERSLKLQSLNWLDEHILACCLNGTGITQLHYENNGSLSLSHFRPNGEQQDRFLCESNSFPINVPPGGFNAPVMHFRKDHFYYSFGNTLLRIGLDGATEILELDANIIKFDITEQHTALKLALLTDEGCLLVTPTLKELKITSPFFVQDGMATDIKLLNDNKLAVACGKQVMIYDLAGKVPELRAILATENPVERIIAIPKRHHCAFLEADNRVSIYNIAETD
jgi:tetratricopeptide (TPR) repeat protein